MGSKGLFSVLAAAAALAWTAPTAAQDDIMEKIINAPHPSAFTVQGLKTPPKPRNDASVQGGKALRIKVPGKSSQTWDISAGNPVQKPVRAGDQLVLAFWARLEEGEAGATTAQLPYNAVQLSKDPYTAVISGPATITPEWKLYEVKGKADRDYAAGDLNISMHLATGKQVIDLGPMFLVNMGQ